MAPIAAAINSDLFLPWVDSGGFGDNFGEGIAFVVVGLIGSMVTAYYAAGGFLPSTGGKAEYDALMLEHDDLRERYGELSAVVESFAVGDAEVSAERREAALKSAEALSRRMDSVSADARALKRSILARSLPFYLLIGPAFAVLFAENLAQALIIGFAWTLLAERFGLKNEQEAKDRMRRDDIAKLEEEARKSERHRSEAAEARADAKAKQQKLDATEVAMKAISDEFARVAAGGPAAPDVAGRNGGSRNGADPKKNGKKAKKAKKQKAKAGK
jgi:hypothetical protein